MSTIKTSKKNYWENRRLSQSTSLSKLKLSPVLSWLFSVRAADEVFLRRQIGHTDYLLDMSCGGGKSVLAKCAEFVVGIDIYGYPSHIAQKRGYKETHLYDRNGTFALPHKFDVITIINVNAHVSFEALKVMLDCAVEHCKDGARVIFVNEYENNSFIYGLIKKNASQYERYVNGCEHFYFHSQKQFLDFMKRTPQLTLETTSILASNPPFSHFLAARGIPNLRLLTLAADAFISVYNNLFANRHADGFLVGHVFSYNRDKT